MAPQVTRALRVLRVPPVLWAPPVLLASLALVAPLDSTDPLDQVGHLALADILALGESPGPKVHRDWMVTMAPLVLPAYQGCQDTEDRQVHEVEPDRQEKWGRGERGDREDCPGKCDHDVSRLLLIC